MRRRARVDRNQAEIVKALRKVGCSVQPLHTVGKGCPDILVGIRGRNLLMEIKDGKLPPSARVLTPDERTWIWTWGGQCAVVHSVDEALTLVNLP